MNVERATLAKHTPCRRVFSEVDCGQERLRGSVRQCDHPTDRLEIQSTSGRPRQQLGDFMTRPTTTIDGAHSAMYSPTAIHDAGIERSQMYRWGQLLIGIV